MMKIYYYLFARYKYAPKMLFRDLLLTILILATASQDVEHTFTQMMGKCSFGSSSFDVCMRNVLNDFRVYFKTGIPQYNIRPFDPHRASYIEQRRGNSNGLLGYKLILRNVSEYGWTNSEITKYKTDPEANRIIYSQYFPEKSLEGFYEFSAGIMGNPIKRMGVWNMTLYDYSQTTSVKRLGGPGSLLKVHVEVDKIGRMNLHISDFFGSDRQILNNIADTVINTMWQTGLPVIKPLINELVSTAFTDIFNESFRHFPLQQFIK